MIKHKKLYFCSRSRKISSNLADRILAKLEKIGVQTSNIESSDQEGCENKTLLSPVPISFLWWWKIGWPPTGALTWKRMIGHFDIVLSGCLRAKIVNFLWVSTVSKFYMQNLAHKIGWYSARIKRVMFNHCGEIWQLCSVTPGPARSGVTNIALWTYATPVCDFVFTDDWSSQVLSCSASQFYVAMFLPALNFHLWP